MSLLFTSPGRSETPGGECVEREHLRRKPWRMDVEGLLSVVSTTVPRVAEDAPESVETVLRAFRYALDPSPAQEAMLFRYAGAARWAFNHALAAKVAAHQQWRTEVEALVAAGTPEDVARKQVKVPLPTKPAIQKAWVRSRGDSRKGIDGICPWWHEVNNYCFQSAFLDADVAWRNWLDSLQGKRAGRRVGYPRFKKRGRSRDSFRLHHDVKRPGIRLVTHRRLHLPKFGEIRLHGSARRLARLIDRGQAVVARPVGGETQA